MFCIPIFNPVFQPLQSSATTRGIILSPIIAATVFLTLIRSLNSLNVRVCESIDVNVSTPIRKNLKWSNQMIFEAMGCPLNVKLPYLRLNASHANKLWTKPFNVGVCESIDVIVSTPIRKKSQVVRLDDFWSHGMSPKREITLLENKCVARKQALINSPLLHWYWNGIYFQGKLSTARHSLASTVLFLHIKKCQALLG